MALDCEMLTAALAYAAKGIPVFPVTPRAKRPPLVKNWPKTATTDPAKIRKWWERWPDANVGIVTGKPSGFFALDVDSHGDNGSETLAVLEALYGPLPLTPEAKTGGGGRHVLFQWPGFEVKNSAGTLGLGLDVRGDGGYIVAPPSVHPSGGTYSWDVGRHPEDLAPAPAPEWLLKAIVGAPRPIPPAARPSPPATAATPALGAFQGVREGQRSDRLYRAACSDRGRGATSEALREGCRQAAARCIPPLPVAEADSTAASAATHPAGLPYCREDARVDPLAALPAACRDVWFHLWTRRERQARSLDFCEGRRLNLAPGEVWSTDASIANGTNIPKRTIARHRDALKAAGLLEWRDAVGRGNVFRFPVPGTGRPQSDGTTNADAGLSPMAAGVVADLPSSGLADHKQAKTGTTARAFPTPSLVNGRHSLPGEGAACSPSLPDPEPFEPETEPYEPQAPPNAPKRPPYEHEGQILARTPAAVAQGDGLDETWKKAKAAALARRSAP